jgi:4'-phosphopantetheinyl transferase EntD
VPRIGLVDQLLPPLVACSESFADPPEAVLFPEEEAVIARAVPKRRLEFTTARYCARVALASLGVPPVPILPGERGAPTWPVGFVGTMTHCAGYRAAAVARTDRVASIGLDAEPHQPLPGGVLPLVTLPEEREWLSEYSQRRPDVYWDRLLFCTKEAVYKGWFPLAQRWLGFQDALVTIDPDGTFEARLLVDGPTVLGGERLTGFQGRWLVSDGLILTATMVLRPAPAGTSTVDDDAEDAVEKVTPTG